VDHFSIQLAIGERTNRHAIKPRSRVLTRPLWRHDATSAWTSSADVEASGIIAA
jgi:hypothetical protein